MNLHSDRGRIVGPTLTSGLLGAMLFVSLCFGWPRPVIDWMRVIVPRSVYPTPAELALRVTAVLTIVTLLLSVVILGARWLLRRLGVHGARGLVLLLILAFALSFIAEAARQVLQAWGNLTASDATGLIVDNARLTPHGWATISRRAVAASAFAGIMAAAFWLASPVHTRGMGTAR